jgi:hypothetical protein
MSYLAVAPHETRCYLITGQLSENDARERLGTFLRGEFKQTTQKSHRILSKPLSGNGFCHFQTSQF